MTKKQKKTLKRIIAAAVLTVLLALLFHFVELPWFVQLVLWLVPYLVIGHDVLRKAFMGIKNGEVFDENFLMAVATVGAIGCGEYAEGVAVMLFYQIGELFQSYAVGKSRSSITALMDIRPDSANLEAGDGSVSVVDPDDVPIGATIVVKPGEKIPLDGVVVVSTPQDLVGMIVRKAVNMANMMNIPVLGLVENMSYALCPDCGRRIELFGKSKIAQEAAALHLPVLAQLPFDPKAAQLCDEGSIETVENPLMADAARAVAGQVGL